MTTTRKKTTRKPQHLKRLLTRLLPALLPSHNPLPTTRSRSSRHDEAQRTSLRVWRILIPATISCPVLQAGHLVARRRRRKTLLRMIAMTIGSRRFNADTYRRSIVSDYSMMRHAVLVYHCYARPRSSHSLNDTIVKLHQISLRSVGILWLVPLTGMVIFYYMRERE